MRRLRTEFTKRYEHCELSNFGLTGPHANLEACADGACKFVEGPLWTILTNAALQHRRRKTHLSVGIIKDCPQQGDFRGCSTITASCSSNPEFVHASVEGNGVDVLALSCYRSMGWTTGAVKPTELVWDTANRC